MSQPMDFKSSFLPFVSVAYETGIAEGRKQLLDEMLQVRAQEAPVTVNCTRCRKQVVKLHICEECYKSLCSTDSHSNRLRGLPN